jgi:G protein-coupled receptor Mth (Methuselah protein)
MNALQLTASLLACICGVMAVHYNELEMMGFQNCPQKNHCAQITNTPFLDRVCECDQACSTFDDCCLNARRVRFRQPSKERCLQYGNLVYQGAYAVANCPANYTGPSEIRVQCMSGNVTDPFLNSPVSDSRTGKTFKNRYCALCNDANSAYLQSWNIAVSCENSNSGDFAFQDLTYRSDLVRWGLNREGRFDKCTLKYDKPVYINNIRLCRANLVSTCPAGYRRQNFVRACEAYMTVVVGRDVMYRNPHCAVCNGVPIDEVFCFSTSLMSRKSNKPFSFALLLDVNRSDGDIVGESNPNTCPSGQKYDPFFKKCRTLVCAIPGFKMQNGKCVKQKKN